MSLEREPLPPQPVYFLGLDLGQAADYTAMAVLEQAPGGRRGNRHYAVRHLERARQLRYTDLVERIVVVDRQVRGLGPHQLIADYTGVGRPVVDQLRAAGLRPNPVTITGGTEATRAPDGSWHVPKRDLVAVVQLLLQTERLQVAADLPLAQTLIQELLAFRIKITAAANDTYGAWREGEHDDLVLAVALAAWYAEQVGGGVGVSFI